MSSIKVFENKKIRTQWNEQEEDWYFSVVDVVDALTDSTNATVYWRKLKQRLKAEGNETVTNCHALKMTAKDGTRLLYLKACLPQEVRILTVSPLQLNLLNKLNQQ